MNNTNMTVRRYLLANSVEHGDLKAFLLRELPRSVYPLLSVGVELCKEFNPLPALSHIPKQYIIPDMPRNFWVKFVAQPIVDDVTEIIEAGGDPAIDSLVRVLWEHDVLASTLSGLVLLQLRTPQRRLGELLVKTYDFLISSNSNKQEYRKSGLPIVVVFALSRTGYDKAEELVNKIAQDNRSSIEDEERKLRNTVLNYLFAETGR
jgi:hypothetical protein